MAVWRAGGKRSGGPVSGLPRGRGRGEPFLALDRRALGRVGVVLPVLWALRRPLDAPPGGPERVAKRRFRPCGGLSADQEASGDRLRPVLAVPSDSSPPALAPRSARLRRPRGGGSSPRRVRRCGVVDEAADLRDGHGGLLRLVAVAEPAGKAGEPFDRGTSLGEEECKAHTTYRNVSFTFRVPPATPSDSDAPPPKSSGVPSAAT